MSEKSASPAKVAQLVAMLCMVGVTFAFGIRVSLRGTSTRKHDAARMDEFDNEEAAFQVALNSALIDSKQTMTFTHQVAGHVREKLRLFQRSVLKPLIKRKHFFREMQFYYAMEKMGNHWMQSAKSFVPALRGLYRTKHEQNDSQNEKGNEIPIKDMKHKEKNWSIFSRDSINAESFTKEFQLYLALEDLTCDLIKPCAIDIKMGTQTFEPDADELKRRREVRKCPHQAQVGFRITGFQVYDVRHDTYGTVSKHFGRRLTVDMIVDALALFFFDGVSAARF